jgi:hypothetical protein
VRLFLKKQFYYSGFVNKYLKTEIWFGSGIAQNQNCGNAWNSENSLGIAGILDLPVVTLGDLWKCVLLSEIYVNFVS